MIGRSDAPRLREVGDAALLIELQPVIDPDVNARAVAIADAIRARALAGVRDVVPTYRTVGVFFDPMTASTEVLRGAIALACQAPAASRVGTAIEVPVTYGGADGPDLETVAAWAGLSAGEVVDRHAAPEYRVFMLGFLPGFAYMGSVDPVIAVPRHQTPRLKVPAGAVGIAGRQTGIYPSESPGGWQLIGRSHVQLFDAARARPSLFAPGDSVRFVAAKGAASHRQDQPPGAEKVIVSRSSRAVTILNPGLFTTVQDLGRWGHQASGVPVAGAMDSASHRRANALVGNEPSAATLEATVMGPEVRFETAATVAIAGADLGALLDGSALPPGSARRCRRGAVLRFGARRRGARSYIAFDGGVDVPRVLGSRATHSLSCMGGLAGRALQAGDRIQLGAGVGSEQCPETPPTPQGGARLRILPGPQADLFDPDAYELLQRSRYLVTPQSNRMGYRLAGPSLPSPADDMISDVTFPGAIQVPPGGAPIMLMADRQTVGGYPQLAIVITADLPLAGQLAPGDWIEFAGCTMREARAAMAAGNRAGR